MDTISGRSRIWIQGIWLLITVSAALAGEVCTYTKKEGNHQLYRKSYCPGHCCDDTASRCCEEDEDVDWWVVGGVLGAVVLLIVFIVILTMCLFKRANRNKTRVGDTRGNNEMQMTIRLPRGERQPNIYFVDPPPYSTARASHSMFILQPSANPVPTIRDEGGLYEEGVLRRSGHYEEGGQRGGGPRGGGHNEGSWPRGDSHYEEGGPRGGGPRGGGHNEGSWPRAGGHYDDASLRVDVPERGPSGSTVPVPHAEHPAPFSSAGNPDSILYDDPTPAPGYYPEKPWAEFPPPAYSFK